LAAPFLGRERAARRRSAPTIFASVAPFQALRSSPGGRATPAPTQRKTLFRQVSISSHWSTEPLTASRTGMRPVSRTVICGRHFLAIKLDFNRGFAPWHEFGKLQNQSVTNR